MTLISASELAAVQSVAESGMIASVYIQTRTTDTTSPDGWVETFVEATQPVRGWLYEFTPGGATIGETAGAMGLAEQSWLRLPVGTAIGSGDRARIGTNVFVIQHTNDSSTYQPWVACAVRLVV